MLACRPTGNPTLTLLAQALRADVLTDTGQDTTTTHNANGSEWYFNADYSWGFADSGESPDKNQCPGGSPNFLCWHTVNDDGGYTCGETDGLSGSTSFEKLIFVPVGVPTVSPWQLVILAGILLTLALFSLRALRRRNRHTLE